MRQMIAYLSSMRYRPFVLLLPLLVVRASQWVEDANGFDDADSAHSHTGRPRRQRSTGAEQTDQIIVDHGAHAARLNVAGTHGRTRRLPDAEPNSAVEEGEQVVLDAMGLGEDDASQPSQGPHGSKVPGFMKRGQQYNDDEDEEAHGNNEGHEGTTGTHLNSSEDDHLNILGDYELPDDSDVLLQEGNAAQFPWWDRRRRRRRIDCSYKTWTGWTSCSKTCGSGTRNRKRTKSGPYHGGRNCAWTKNLISESCNTNLCPVPCYWTTWSGWATCSLTCGSGQKTRTRMKDGPYHNGNPCTGDTIDTLNCNEFSCPQDLLLPALEWMGSLHEDLYRKRRIRLQDTGPRQGWSILWWTRLPRAHVG
jgi:hypothetical protein